MTAPTDLARLRDYDTPTVLNAIELFDVRPRHDGFLGGDIGALFPEFGPVVGYASTATFTSARPADEGDAYANLVVHSERMEAELPEPRIVVFQDIDPEPVGATFGEVMCTVYKAWGARGLITSGAARDVDQVRQLGFPCWSRNVIASHAWCRIVDVHVPVDILGVPVAPGDLLHADANGVAILPADLVAEVTVACGLLVEAEAAVLQFARARVDDRRLPRDIDGLRAAYGRTKELFDGIAERARRVVASREEG